MNSRRIAPPVLTLAALAVLVLPARAQTWEAIPANPRVEFAYIPPKSPQLEQVYQELKDRKMLEELQHFLSPLHLPHRLRLIADECNKHNDRHDKGINAFYRSHDRSLTLCYELVAAFISGAPQTVSEDGFITREAAITGGIIGVLLHEGGHMMFDMLDVPVFGREEDAADQNASFIGLQFNKDVARTIIKGFAYQWAREQDPSASAPMGVWSDEHGMASQRMYNALCLGYGGDPQTFREFVDRGWLPKKRAAHCGQEYAQLKLAFDKTIVPFLDVDLVNRVRQAQWLTSAELK